MRIRENGKVKNLQAGKHSNEKEEDEQSQSVQRGSYLPLISPLMASATREAANLMRTYTGNYQDFCSREA